ncbi:MAG: hypothetical protein AB7N76_17570 [Planctomycetota bacterium]
MKRATISLCLLALVACAAPSEPAPGAKTPADSSSPAPREPSVALGDVESSQRVLPVLPLQLQDLLLGADRLELLALICERDPDPGEATLGDYPVRSRVELRSPRQRAEVLGAVYTGIAQGGPVAFCFEPHHALVATRGAERVELVICFTCAQVELRRDGETLRTVATSDHGQELLNRALGQPSTVPGNEAGGRSLDYWDRALRAGLAAGDLGAEGYRAAATNLADLLQHHELGAEELKTVVGCIEAQFVVDPAEAGYVLQETARQGECARHRVAAIELAGRLARAPGQGKRREVLTDLLRTLFDDVLARPDEQSAAARAAARAALPAFRWVAREELQDMLERAEGEEDPALRQELLAALAPLRR